MKVLIVEDEVMAVERLSEMVLQLEPDFEIVETLDTVVTAREWLVTHDSPDLIFLDIQLADGLSFEIFDGISVKSPIIFTTAYDGYAIKAFKLNSIDYLLKPIDKGELEQSLKKFRTSLATTSQTIDTQKLFNLLATRDTQFKERFVIKIGEHIKTVMTADAQVFFSHEKATYLQTADAKKFIIDYPLDQLETMVNPRDFFRISRKFIVNISSIRDILVYSNSRLKIALDVDPREDIIVARDRVNEFKSWLDR